MINLVALGAIPGDVPTHADANADVLQAACAQAIATGESILIDDFFQIGVRSSGTNLSFITPSFTDGCRLRFIGTGTLKEKDGKTASVGNFNKMFFFSIPTGVKVAEIYFAPGLTLDKNGRASFPTGQSNGAGGYDWQQSHTINIVVNGTGALNRLEITGVTFRDKTSAHVVIAGSGASGPVRQGVIRDCSFVDWIGADYGFSQRGCIECQGAGTIDVVDCFGRYLQTEPNGGGYSRDKPLDLRIRGGSWAFADLVGIEADQAFIAMGLIGTKVGFLNVADCMLNMTDCDWTYSPTNSWYNVKGLIKGGIARLATSAGAIAAPIRPRTIGAGMWDLEFDNVSLTLDDPASGNVTGFIIAGNQPNNLAAARAIRTTLTYCRYDPRFEHIADAYRETGTVVIRGGAPKCTGYGFRVGGTSTPHYGFLELYDVDYRGIGGTKVMFSGATSNFGLRMTGEYPVGEISFGLENGATVAHVDGVADIIFPKLVGDAVPSSGAFFRGMRQKKRLPAAAASPGWFCTTSHASNGGVWTAEN